MSTKKTNIAELEQQCLEAEKNFKILREQFEAAKREEEETKRAKIAAEKESRYKEVVNAYEKFDKLRSKYVDDYGSFTFKTEKANKNGTHDWFWSHVGLF